jgi:hypothetical protein
MWKRILYFVFTLFAVLIGLFLMALPWSSLWERNIVLSLLPSLRPALLSNFFRGALTGLGLVNIWVGFSYLWRFRDNLAAVEQKQKKEVVSSQSSVIGNRSVGKTEN